MKINNSKTKEIISLEGGWTRIKTGGLDAFLERVEKCNEKELSTRPNPAKEMEIIIDIVFQMCIQREPNNFSEAVYNRVAETTKSYFNTFHNRALDDAKRKSEHAFLTEMAKRWKQCTYTVHGIKRMFNYLNRYHVPNSDGLLNLVENGYNIWKENVFDRHSQDLRNAILGFITRERNSEVIDSELLKNNIYIFVGLGQELKTEYKTKMLQIYEQGFQNEMIRLTKQFYQLASDQWLSKKSTPEYLVSCEVVQNEEMGRLKSYLHPSTESDLMLTLRTCLLKLPQDRLLKQESGLVRMLDEQAATDLERLYHLFRDVEDGIKPIAKKFRSYIEELGQDYIKQAQEADKKKQDTKKNLDLISKIIALHERFHGHVVRDFQHDPELTRSLKDAFESFINQTNYVVKYLARYAHHFMVKGGPSDGMNPTEKDEQMDHIRMIYGYIRDKDVFEREYQWYLSKRLLENMSSADEMEQRMIGLLKKECGYHWAQKLEDMFKDMQTSKELMREFRKNNKMDFDLDVNICEYGKWPETADQKKLGSMCPPGELEDVKQRLKNFYEDKHPGRKFFIRWDKGSGEARVLFNKKTKNEKLLIFKNLYQIMVMLVFNEKNSKGKPIWTFGELSQKLKIPDAELKNALLPLYNPKLKVLQKKPNSRDIEPDHLFRMNGKFSNPNRRVIVPNYRIVKNEKEPEVPPEVLQQRKHQMDAAIVRIMKARRQFSIQELLGEVNQQLCARFKPDPKQIRKRIEALITQDYLERDEDERNQLIYKQ